MNYIIAIKTAVILFPILAFLITGPFILQQYHKFASINPLKTIILYSFIFYLLCAYFLVILPLPPMDTIQSNPDWMIQPIPFHFIIDLIKETPFQITAPSTYIKAIIHPSFYIVIFNIILLIPFGMFLTYYKGYSLKKVIKYSFLLSLFFEFTQLTRLYGIYPKPYRLCDIDDLILNTLGGVIGYNLMKKIENKVPSKKELEEKSYQKGTSISPLKRITLFFLDFFLYLTLLSFTKGEHPYILFIIYFTIIPICYHQKTLGSAFLNIRLTKIKKTPLYYLRPYFLYAYYIFTPYFIMKITTIFIKNIKNTNIMIIYEILVMIGIFVFYIINLWKTFRKKTRFYDTLFATKYESTINETRRRN